MKSDGKIDPSFGGENITIGAPEEEEDEEEEEPCCIKLCPCCAKITFCCLASAA